MRVHRFQSRAFSKPTYKCRCCNKTTRETGDDESSVELCRACYRDATAENDHLDNHDTPVDGCRFCIAEAAGEGWSCQH